MTKADFPIIRMRRLRKSAGIRRLLSENHVRACDLIYPIFVEEELDQPTPINSLPGVQRETEKTLAGRVKEIYDQGIPAIILFGVSHHKDHTGSDSLTPKGLLARMIKTAKQACPDMVVIADICFCEYTDHGHCGPLADDGAPDNDKTLVNLGKQAVICAEAGADIVAPSGMMDGMVGAIRAALDKAGHIETPILSYAAKFSSHHYGPFRDAAGCSLADSPIEAQADRKAYQMNPANREEALREVELDIQEGADMIIVKPGLPYLDIIRDIKNTYNIPVIAYHVSGEYAMIRAAAQNGWVDYDNILMEQMVSFKRAGCTGIITYGAPDIAKML